MNAYCNNGGEKERRDAVLADHSSSVLFKTPQRTQYGKNAKTLSRRNSARRCAQGVTS